MNVPRLLAVAVLAIAVPTFAHAGKGKGKGKGKGEPAPAAAPISASPSEALSPYITNIDQLLALERKGPPKGQTLFDQASGHVATLRQQFVVEREKADETGRAKFDAAIATCDALTGALNERQKVLGDIQSSQSVAGSGKLEKGPRKDNLAQGLTGGGYAKAVGTRVELKRERAANRRADDSAAKNDDAITAMSVNRWNQRTIELRQQITASYARIK